MSWTDERIDQLKAMWERGLTASQIADELGGVSRNAVIGKAHRLGLQSRPSPVKANEVPKKARKRSMPHLRRLAPPRLRRPPLPLLRKRQRLPRRSRASSRSGRAAFYGRVRATSRRRSRLPRRAAWYRRSPARKLPGRPRCSI